MVAKKVIIGSLNDTNINIKMYKLAQFSLKIFILIVFITT